MNQNAVDFVIGLVLPPFIDLVNKRVSSGNVKYVISVVAALLVGGVIAFLRGDLTSVSFLQGGAIVFGAAQTTFKLYWADSSVRKNLIK